MATTLDTQMDQAMPVVALSNAAQEIWDCLVIGGGIAGSLAARQISRLGLKTLLVEKQEFPRAKVCGSCLNQRAIDELQRVGLASMLGELGGRPTHRLLYTGFGRRIECDVPAGLALTRSVLDEALLEQARASGVEVIHEVVAQVLPTSPDASTREVRLAPTGTHPDALNDIRIRTKSVIAADGLGHPSLRKLPEFAESVKDSSKVGLGAIITQSSWEAEVGDGDIHMYASRHGYAGIVRAEKDKIALAAAVNPGWMKDCGRPVDAFNQLLQEAGSQLEVERAASWRGTQKLSRSINEVANQRIFVVGDAAGYVEPFTGEGMAWAIAGGIAIADCVQLLAEGQEQLAVNRWKQDWLNRVRSRQFWCRVLSWTLRHPSRARLGTKLMSTHPLIATTIAKQLGAATH